MTRQVLPPIPEKDAFKIGEASTLVGVPAHVLRFWEREFPSLRPRKSPSGHRLYARGDVVLLRHIRTLLHDRGYTIAGARGLLAEGPDALEAALAARPVEAANALEEARDRLSELEAAQARLEEQHRQGERALARAREEAAFWRASTLRAERALTALRARVLDEVAGLEVDLGVDSGVDSGQTP
ncbi:MAG: MerR family transcriptional regulator [Myxococcales bacterium]|nr:MerR family transcriptional regulator [Myxococcales bacterium]